jgi:hypothetical protein
MSVFIPLGFGYDKLFIKAFAGLCGAGATASSNRTTRAIVQQNYSPYTEYKKQVFNIGTTWRQYTMSFTSPVTDTNLKFDVSAADTV